MQFLLAVMLAVNLAQGAPLNDDGAGSVTGTNYAADPASADAVRARQLPNLGLPIGAPAAPSSGSRSARDAIEEANYGSESTPSGDYESGAAPTYGEPTYNEKPAYGESAYGNEEPTYDNKPTTYDNEPAYGAPTDDDETPVLGDGEDPIVDDPIVDDPIVNRRRYSTEPKYTPSAWGYAAQASATGYASEPSASGYASEASASGYDYQPSASGYDYQPSASGYASEPAVSGYDYQPSESASGYASEPSAAGYTAVPSNNTAPAYGSGNDVPPMKRMNGNYGNAQGYTPNSPPANQGYSSPPVNQGYKPDQPKYTPPAYGSAETVNGKRQFDLPIGGDDGDLTGDDGDFGDDGGLIFGDGGSDYSSYDAPTDNGYTSDAPQYGQPSYGQEQPPPSYGAPAANGYSAPSGTNYGKRYAPQQGSYGQPPADDPTGLPYGLNQAGNGGDYDDVNDNGSATGYSAPAGNYGNPAPTTGYGNEEQNQYGAPQYGNSK